MLAPMPLPAAVVPDRAYLRELLRPWKPATFAGSLAVLLYGALTMDIGDWDVGVTLVMGALTYVLAPWCVHLVHRAWRSRPRHWPWHVLLSLALAVFVVDTVYMAYSRAVGNPTDREGNFLASFPLFYLAGVLWSWRGSVRELVRALRDVRLRQPPP
jgi:hypothetical protein